MAGNKFNPSNDIPDLAGRVILVTGGNTGLGKETIAVLAKHNPSKIFLTARNAQKATTAIEEIKKTTPDASLSFLECDLTSLASVRRAARAFVEQSQRLDILMCNAGIMAVPPELSKDGYEIQFAANHLGHALLMKLLLPTLLKTAAEPDGDVRVISLSSTGAWFPPKAGIQFDALRTPQELGIGGRSLRYGQSKLANILYAGELAGRYPQLTSLSIHPEIIQTQLVDTQPRMTQMLIKVSAAVQQHGMLPPEEGALNQLWAATARKEDLKNGAFYTPVGQLAKPFKYSQDVELREKLWAWTQKELENYSL
ncbi:NAD(P)-binding protein [Viridothelium virens]|uniref:NAD(P)-binding protein n=1 Tax=Viridothelium virens TaxID=1048519 RepID=A0A6A6GXP2_VIRVR|nr:NAD(P)-binding protein [Viridothelium virens]